MRYLAVFFLFLGGCDDAFPGAKALDMGADVDGMGQTDGGGADLSEPEPTGPCDVTFRYQPPAGRTVTTVEARGEWNAFADPGLVLKPVAGGAFEGTITLDPGMVGYKLVIDGSWELDPGARLRKYVGGQENSAMRVANCHIPKLALAQKTLTRPASGQGQFVAQVSFTASVEGAALDPATVKATLRKDRSETPIAQVVVTASDNRIDLTVPQLADGKYTVLVDARDVSGRRAHTARLVFWVEARPFDWRDGLIYMVMIDRFRDGDPANNAAPTAGVESRADFQGGDLQGVRQAIADGTFDKLGVTALWLSPFHANPAGKFVADDGVHQVMGYHGYWPVKAREVDARIGGAAALEAMVAEAHAHGIRVLQDYVVNHVHQDHEYFTQHPSWFRTGCVCGQGGCDWTAKRLECLFSNYLPDVNWSVPEVSEQYADDAVWWLDRFDLDGLRVDAVKHVEDLAVLNMTARIRDEFEAAGTRVFLTGETAMGWNDCATPGCNASEYGTISRYLGPNALDGQADFVLHHAVPYRVFSSDTKGLIHADYWTRQSVVEYPAAAVMTPYIGSHDTPRFVTLSSYRGQDGAHAPGIAGNKWDNIAGPPPDAEPYARHRLALAWLLTLPGAPLVYYGDEYGEWGGADPNNRAMWRGTGTLSGEESATLAHVRALGTARKELTALRRGDYQPIYNTAEDQLLYARKAGPGEVALVALNRSAGSASFTATLPGTLGLANGTVLHDRLGGPDVTVQTGAVTVNLGSRGAAILAP